MKTIEYLKSQCNRYTNGQCHTRKCLVNGGYKDIPPVDYDIATCEYHDAITRLDACTGIQNPAAVKECVEALKMLAKASTECAGAREDYAVIIAIGRAKVVLASLEKEGE